VSPIADLLEHRVGERRIPQGDEFVRSRDRERPQHDRVDEREDGGHPANPAGQRKHGGESEPGSAPELPQRKAHVVRDLVQ
jgi:hypothetical protein